MRISTPLAPVCAALLAVSGCSVTPGQQFDPYTLYLTTPAPVQVRAELLDRYACANQAPLACECVSRLSDCQCRC